MAVGFPSAPNAPLTQIGNRFDANHIGQDGLRSSLAPGGGGEWVGGLDLTSRNDRFTSNSLAQAVGGGAEAEGGGLGLEGCGSLGTPTDVLETDDAVLIFVALPGVDPEKVDVAIHNGVLLLAGEDTKVVSERLGHGSTATTEACYQHVLPTMQKQAAEKMGRILGAMLPPKPPAENGRN